MYPYLRLSEQSGNRDVPSEAGDVSPPAPSSQKSKRIGFVLLVLVALGLNCVAFIPRPTDPLIYDSTRFAFAAIVLGRLFYVIGCATRRSLGKGRLGSDFVSRVYSVPRRFGIATLLLMTLVFALLSGVLRYVQAGPIAAGLTLGFVGLVCALQLVFDRAPRHASMIAGAISFPLAGLVMYLFWKSNFLPLLSQLLFSAAWLSLWGSFLGYLTGTLIAGLFLVGHSLQGVFFSRDKPK